MKKIYFPLLVLMLTLSSCANLDINPLSQASSENWYNDEDETEMSLNDLWRTAFFPIDGLDWDDDILNRNGSNEFTLGTVTSQSGTTTERWSSAYKAISRSLKILDALENKTPAGITEAKLKQYKGEAYFMVGCAYGTLTMYYGDCVLNKTGMSLDEAYEAERSPKAEVLQFAYECLDKAYSLLPEKFVGTMRPTKGAALAFKTRIALFHGDWQIAATAAEQCMALGTYQLHNDFASLFTADTSPELIFYFKADINLKYGVGFFSALPNYVTRKIGGYCNTGPSLPLLCSFTCIDGLPIDESPLYNPKDPFENRDPRLACTIQPFKTKYSKDFDEYEQSKVDGTFPEKYPDYIAYGYEYNPNPYAVNVYQVTTGQMVVNTDGKGANEHSAYNSLIIRKFRKDNWTDYRSNSNIGDNVYPYMRYAEVLLSYAEAMNELGKCTQDILDKTVNLVRQRAYQGTNIAYPRAMATSQAAIRKLIRIERRSEFAFEGIRYRDLLRWHIMEKTHNVPMYYLNRSWSGSAAWNGKRGAESNRDLSVGFQQILDNWDNGNFPVGGVPAIDENGIPDLSEMEANGYIVKFYQMQFDAKKNYLWPIPADDILVNPKLTQNPEY